jgi:rhodanese-related sulfurtransferase
MLSVDTAAEPATAAAHFAARLQFETDVSDVHDALHETPAALVVVDSRGQAAWDQGHVPDAIHLPTPSIADRASALIPRDVLVVTYCWGPACNGATRAALEFARLGYRVKEMIGGYEYWVREGLPVATSTGLTTRAVDALVAPATGVSCAC